MNINKPRSEFKEVVYVSVLKDNVKFWWIEPSHDIRYKYPVLSATNKSGPRLVKLNKRNKLFYII